MLRAPKVAPRLPTEGDADQLRRKARALGLGTAKPHTLIAEPRIATPPAFAAGFPEHRSAAQDKARGAACEQSRSELRRPCWGEHGAILLLRSRRLIPDLVGFYIAESASGAGEQPKVRGEHADVI